MSWGSGGGEPGPGGLLVGYLADDEHRPKSAAALGSTAAAMTAGGGCIPYLQQQQQQQQQQADRYVISGGDDHHHHHRNEMTSLPMDAYGNHYVPYNQTNATTDTVTSAMTFHPHHPIPLPHHHQHHHPQMSFQFEMAPPPSSVHHHHHHHAVDDSDAAVDVGTSFSTSSQDEYHVSIAMECNSAPPPHHLPHPPSRSMDMAEETSYGGSDRKGTLDPYYAAETVGDGTLRTEDASDCPVVELQRSSYEAEMENGRDVTGVGNNDAPPSLLVDMPVAVEAVSRELVARESVARETFLMETVAREMVARETVARETVAREQGNIEDGSVDLSTTSTRGVNDVSAFEPTPGGADNRSGGDNGSGANNGSGADNGSGGMSMEDEDAEEDSDAAAARERAGLVECSLAEATAAGEQ